MIVKSSNLLMEINMKKIVLVLAVMSLLFTVSCSKKYIKGTNIVENEDSKAIFTVFGHYVKGFKEQNPEIFSKYISETYYDSNGTDDPSDDVDHDKIMEILNSDQFKALKKVDIVYIVKDLKVDKALKTAKMVYYFEVRFKRESRIKPEEESAFVESDGMTNHKVSDNNMMKFVKEDDGWKIVSGI